MLSLTAASFPSTPSSLHSTPPSIGSDGPGSFALLSLPPTHASEQSTDSLTSSLSTLQLSPRESIATTDTSSKGSSPATLSPPMTRSPSPPNCQEDASQEDMSQEDSSQEDSSQEGEKLLKEKKKHRRPLAGASSDMTLKLQQLAKTRKSAGHGQSEQTQVFPIPVTAPIDPPYVLPYTQMAPCVLLPNGQFMMLNPLEWAHMTTDTGAYTQMPISTQQASHTTDPSASVPAPGVGVATPLMDGPTAYVQPIPAWGYGCGPYLVPQMIEGYVPTNGRRRVRPGFCLFTFHLPPETVDEELFQLFSQYGTVFSAKVIRDKATQDSKGYGFVNMATEQQADYAIERLNGSRYKNKYLKVSYKKKKSYSGKSLR